MTRTVCMQAIYDLAKQDERVIFIGSDLGPTTLSDFKKEFPNRFLMEGICEQNIIGMAAGLALEGFIPYVCTIATFLTRRCYEQIAIDICLHNLPVRLIANGGGLVYSPLGATHTAIEDMAIMRNLPNMSVICCADNQEMKAFMPTTLGHKGPMYIRLGKDSDPLISENKMRLSRMPDGLFIGTGMMTNRLIDMQKALKLWGIEAHVLHVSKIKPLELTMPSWLKFIVTAEEGLLNGGLGTAVLELLNKHQMMIPVLRFGIPDEFPQHYGEQEDLLETYGLTADKMGEKVKEFYAKLEAK